MLCSVYWKILGLDGQFINFSDFQIFKRRRRLFYLLSLWIQMYRMMKDCCCSDKFGMLEKYTLRLKISAIGLLIFWVRQGWRVESAPHVLWARG